MYKNKENKAMDIQERITARAELAKTYFTQGYNCAQAVSLAFEDLMGIDKDTLLRLSSSFGGGMGRMREVCGAVSGMFMVEGVLLGYSSPKDIDGKKELYSKIRELAATYSAENGSIICRELLEGVPHTDGGVPERRNAEYYKKRPCAELVEFAAKTLAEHLIHEGIEGV